MLDAPLRKAGNEYFIVGTGLPYSPKITDGVVFTLVSPDRPTSRILKKGTSTKKGTGVFLLNRIVAADGGTSLRVTDSGIIAPDGSRLTIVRDALGRVSELVGPESQHLVYRYDELGRLAGVVNVTANQREFYRYDAHGVLQETPRHLGGARVIVAAPMSGSLVDGNDSYSFTITDGELRSSPRGSIGLGIEVRSNDFAPDAVAISGLTPGLSQTTDGRSLAIFSIERAGTYTVTVAGLSGGAGDYTVHSYLIGDVDGDADVDADDSSAFAAAQTTFDARADFDRDGDVDAVDRAGLQSAFGFVANQPPTAQSADGPLTIRGGQPRIVDLNSYFNDPESDAMFFRITMTDSVDVRMLGGGLVSIRAHRWYHGWPLDDDRR